jgi:hypothetical protein
MIMSARTVITHAQNQGAPMPVRGTVAVSTGTGALIIMDAYEVLDFHAQGIRPDVVTAPLGSAERARELAEGASPVRACACGDVVPVAGEWDVQVVSCAQCRGVSLAKPGDYANGVVMVPSEAALDALRDRRGCNVTALAPLLPIGAERALDRNDMRALRIALDVATRVRPRW